MSEIPLCDVLHTHWIKQYAREVTWIHKAAPPILLTDDHFTALEKAQAVTRDLLNVDIADR